ncbi:NifB/NifX family molybdenum-iron cluster-binding protein [Thermanaerovibrio acidaminovorans]|jgi:predicted Fe-Mo cluster-binding NifX family protein|uniref:Dinitrogenase iron-molybdenum cofactor biosynthesis protein n=1 Tax=Thermanaerovibrio acidaminovorans (strain ATCC 49978 / DSM 6589 / Su883) TaxID=525903 RepID=D1B8M9_THEAS|nr:NifB/NifX family molybdenum-iron cluster-binding protein [Thermanaerovibrio acidaminovorans]ACZ18632.1 Dinitrogenase iron-molybdenum cofactor biosynthesis protein [Thermanaerovibrio acidaminovorans DSM 6589]
MIAVAAEGREPSARPAERFARAPWFLIFDPSGSFVQAMDLAVGEHGAAAAAVGLLSAKGVSVVLAPRLGPNAASALKAANMRAYLAEGATAADCVARYLSGEAIPLD